MAIRRSAFLQSKASAFGAYPSRARQAWCPIRGNANMVGQSQRSLRARHKTRCRRVMAFKRPPAGTRMGHVRLVSEVVSPREIKVDTPTLGSATRSRLAMTSKTCRPANDWSDVRLESQAGSFGSVYPINGFILTPNTKKGPSNEMGPGLRVCIFSDTRHKALISGAATRLFMVQIC